MPDNYHINNLLHDVNWTYVAAILGMAIGAVIWAARQTFSTKVHTEACKVDLLAELHAHEKRGKENLQAHEDREEKTFDEFSARNDTKHDQLDGKLDKIIGHLLDD